MRVIVTGSRKWANVRAIGDALWDVYERHGPFHLMHGDCSTGADHWARAWAESIGAYLGCTEQRYPAAWERPDGTIDKGAGPRRNKLMVEAGADLVLAFPLPEGSGTQQTIALAREAGIKVREFKEG